MPVRHHVYHVVHQNHLAEGFRAGEEIFLQLVAEVAEYALEHVVGTDKRGNVVTPGQTHRYLVYILGSVYLALKHGIALVVQAEIPRPWCIYIFIASGILEPPVLGILQLLDVAPGIQYLVVVARILARIIGKQHGEDIVVLVAATDERPAEVDTLVDGAASRYHLVLEDALQLHVLYLRVEGSVVDVERGRDISLMLRREDDLSALGEIFSVLDAHVRGHHLFSQAKGVGISQYHAVVVACRNIQRRSALPVVVEERVGAFHLQLGSFAKLVGLSFIKIRYFHVLKILFLGKLPCLVSLFLLGIEVRKRHVGTDSVVTKLPDQCQELVITASGRSNSRVAMWKFLRRDVGISPTKTWYGAGTERVRSRFYAASQCPALHGHQILVHIEGSYLSGTLGCIHQVDERGDGRILQGCIRCHPFLALASRSLAHDDGRLVDISTLAR